nr:MAG TPA: hypothetical protein [Caudoviricetes sp.]
MLGFSFSILSTYAARPFLVLIEKSSFKIYKPFDIGFSHSIDYIILYG